MRQIKSNLPFVLVLVLVQHVIWSYSIGCVHSSPSSMNSRWRAFDFCLYCFALTLMTSVCPVLMCVCAHEGVFWMCACSMFVCLSICWCVCTNVMPCHLPMHPHPCIRGPGGEWGQRGNAGGCRHPRDQCDRCERRAHAQRRLHAAAPWWPHPARLRRIGRCLWGQHGCPMSWLQHAWSGGQEAEVCKADGGEWGFWVSLHREEPVLRSCPSSPLPHSWGNLGNRVWGRGLNSCMVTSPLHLAPSSTNFFLPKHAVLSHLSVQCYSFIHLFMLYEYFLSNSFLNL